MEADKERVAAQGGGEAREGDEETEKALNISLNEVYERLEELDSDNAEARAVQLLAGLGFDKNMQAKPTRVQAAAGACALRSRRRCYQAGPAAA